MLIAIRPIFTTSSGTISALFINSAFECFTCEDPIRQTKIQGATAIPAGTYPIVLRKEGAMHESYSRRFLNHEGMLWLRNVPNFEWVYIHIGNTPADTDGCILVGQNAMLAPPQVLSSVAAYTALYAKVLGALRIGPVTISITR